MWWAEELRWTGGGPATALGPPYGILAGAQKKLGCPRASLGSLSEAADVFDPDVCGLLGRSWGVSSRVFHASLSAQMCSEAIACQPESLTIRGSRSTIG